MASPPAIDPTAVFDAADLTEDAFLGGRLSILQPRSGYRAATDPVLLAAAVPALAGQSVLDLGCGAGVAALCLGARLPDVALAGLELQPEYADLARCNAARNGIALEVHEGDLTRPPVALRRGFDHVIANPPFFAPRSGPAAADPGRETAQREATPFAAWATTARRRLLPGGWFTLIHSAERLPEILAALDGFGAIAVLPLSGRQGREAGRVLLRARKGARGPFRLLAPLVLHEGAAHFADRDSYAPAIAAVLRDAAALPGFD